LGAIWQGFRTIGKNAYDLLSAIAQIFDTLGIGYELEINSLGCSECMPPYKENLVGYLNGSKGELCEDCNRRIELNPIRVLDCKNEKCKSVLVDAPKLLGNLCDDCSSDFDKLMSLLDRVGIEYKINTNLVRGLDYYNKSAFEFISNEIGAQSAIAGGGRYDRLVEYLDGKPTPGIGFAMGIERIADLVEMPEEKKNGIYLGAMSSEAVELLFDIAKRKRLECKVTVEYSSKGFKSHMKGADKANAQYAMVAKVSQP